MSITDAVSLGSDLFRVSYEALDAITHPKPILPTTQLSLQDLLTQVVLKRFEQVTKNHLALIDAFFSVGRFTNPYFECLALPYRLATLARGVYLIQTDPNADKAAIQLEGILQVLNISRLAATLLDSKISLLFQVGDTAIRLYSIMSNRLIITDRIKETLRGLDFSALFVGVKRLVIELPSYALRTVIATAIIFSNLNLIQRFVHFAYGISINSLGEIGGGIILTGGLAYSINQTMQQVFGGVQTQKNTERRVIEIGVSIISASTLVAASAVGLGRATSLSSIFKPLYPLIFLTMVTSTITMLFKDVINQGILKICDRFDINVHNTKRSVRTEITVISYSITVISSFAIAFFASIQLGILSSLVGFNRLVLQIFAPLGIALLCLDVFRRSARTFVFGAPEWNEMFDRAF